ncbi:hypothetical protein [Streptomyces sp. NRRL S-244]|uniref:hypothetical protein n=1 Tax=Streptomyces sp. NRRL S-244 TaxID=1463897 RepID=UPI001F2F6467|nr:hypothetical protein [Streptomyces sp. NRRL S-244]
MTFEDAAAGRPRRMQHVTSAGSALAVALVPLVVGVLVAKGIAADPHTPVNALITGGGQRAGLPRAEWRRRGHATMRRLRTARQRTARQRTARPCRRPAVVQRGADRPDSSYPTGASGSWSSVTHWVRSSGQARVSSRA